MLYCYTKKNNTIFLNIRLIFIYKFTIDTVSQHLLFLFFLFFVFYANFISPKCLIEKYLTGNKFKGCSNTLNKFNNINTIVHNFVFIEKIIFVFVHKSVFKVFKN